MLGKLALTRMLAAAGGDLLAARRTILSDDSCGAKGQHPPMSALIRQLTNALDSGRF